MGLEVFTSTLETSMQLLAGKLGGTVKKTSDKEELHFGNSPLYLWRYLETNANASKYNYQVFVANNVAQTAAVASLNLGSGSLCTYINKSHTVRVIGINVSCSLVIAEDQNNGLTALLLGGSNYLNWLADNSANVVVATTLKGQVLTQAATSIFKCPNIVTGYMFKDLYWIFTAPTYYGGTQFSMGGKKYMCLGNGTLPFAVEVE